MFICFANAIVANTPYLADILKELGCGAEILKTIPVGVDTSFFIPKKVVQKVSGTLNIITVGRLSLEKGHIYALNVIKVLKNKGLDIHFRIVGEGQERLRLEQYIMESNLNNYVTLEGSKSQEEVRDLLWCSDLFLFTSIALGDGRSETQGLATIEAAAFGLPSVVFDSGGVKHTVNDGVTGFIGYFVLGYYLSQIDTKGKGIPLLLVLSGIFITIFGTYFFTIQNMEFYDYFYEYLTLNALMVSSGLFLLFNKSIGPNERINSITFKLNQSCFGIYLIHPLVLRLFKIIGFDGLMSSPILSIFLVSIICFICSFFLISFVKKLKFGFLTS